MNNLPPYQNRFVERILVVLLISMCGISSVQAGGFPELSGPYFGQQPPGRTPDIFAPRLVSTGYSERGPAFTPDGREMFFTLWGVPFGVFLHTKEVNGHWTEPKVAPFSGRYQGEMSMSPDGNTIVFSSNEPFENSPGIDEYWVWRVERGKTGWGKPEPMGPEVNSGRFAGYPYLAKSGNLYFFSEREDGMGSDDIYMAEWVDGNYKASINLGASINTDRAEVDPAVAPDESYIIFARRKANSVVDLFISFRKDDQSWSEARNMGEKINSEESEFCPVISADGKYIFFTSDRRLLPERSDTPITYQEKIRVLNNPGNGSTDIYWVSSKVIEELRPEDLK